jgi:DNA-binding Xre family transcriptional regulator
MKSKKNPRIGSDLDDFLREEGIYEEVVAAALKKTVAIKFGRQMRNKGMSVASLAKRLGTSRAVVHRVLDAKNTSLTLHTLARTASALGCQVRLEIVAA